MRWFEGPPVARGMVAALVVIAALAGALVGRELGGGGGAKSTVTVTGACPPGFHLVGYAPAPVADDSRDRVQDRLRLPWEGGRVCLED